MKPAEILKPAEICDLAKCVLADYDAIRPGESFASGLRLELADAWRIQTAVTRLREARGERVAGYKVGAVSPGNQQMLGLTQPVWGRLWASELYQHGARLQRSAYANLAIEAEFCILLARDVEPDMSVDQLAGCVEAVYPTLELHNLQLRSDPPHGPELVANNCINCGVVMGAALTQLEKPCVTSLALLYDAKVVDAWEALRWPHDILAAVGWLSQSLALQDIHLQRGDLVLTSAWGPPIPVEDHCRIAASSSVFGDVFADIA